MPELNVVAAGSLLDFTIEAIGLPVGRVNFLYMHPMSFLEFISALEEDLLIKSINSQQIGKECKSAIHEKSLRLLGEYMAIGGMPEAVATWRDRKDYHACLETHHD